MHETDKNIYNGRTYRYKVCIKIIYYAKLQSSVYIFIIRRNKNRRQTVPARMRRRHIYQYQSTVNVHLLYINKYLPIYTILNIPSV
jgi:hypothetical protein